MNHFSSSKVNFFSQQLSIFQHLIGSSNSLRRTTHHRDVHIYGVSCLSTVYWELPEGKDKLGIFYTENEEQHDSSWIPLMLRCGRLMHKPKLRCIHTTNQHVRNTVTVIIIYSVICHLDLAGRSADAVCGEHPVTPPWYMLWLPLHWVSGRSPPVLQFSNPHMGDDVLIAVMWLCLIYSCFYEILFQDFKLLHNCFAFLWSSTLDFHGMDGFMDHGVRKLPLLRMWPEHHLGLSYITSCFRWNVH